MIVSGHEMFAMTNEIWKLAFILSKDKKELPTIIGRYDLHFQLFLVIVLYWEMKVVQISPIYRIYIFNFESLFEFLLKVKSWKNFGYAILPPLSLII